MLYQEDAGRLTKAIWVSDKFEQQLQLRARLTKSCQDALDVGLGLRHGEEQSSQVKKEYCDDAGKCCNARARREIPGTKRDRADSLNV